MTRRQWAGDGASALFGGGAVLSLVVAYGLVAVVLRPEAFGESEPGGVAMRVVEVVQVNEPQVFGEAVGQVDRVVAVPGGQVAHGWVAWSDPSRPLLATTSADVGPAVAHDRSDVPGGLYGAGNFPGFQVLLPSGSSVPCLLVPVEDGYLRVSGSDEAC